MEAIAAVLFVFGILMTVSDMPKWSARKWRELGIKGFAGPAMALVGLVIWLVVRFIL
jgi:hypothetical protein